MSAWNDADVCKWLEMLQEKGVAGLPQQLQVWMQSKTQKVNGTHNPVAEKFTNCFRES